MGAGWFEAVEIGFEGALLGRWHRGCECIVLESGCAVKGRPIECRLGREKDEEDDTERLYDVEDHNFVPEGLRLLGEVAT